MGLRPHTAIGVKGVNTVSGAASTVYTKMYRKEQYTFGFRTNLRYGQSRIDGNTRKSDDLISIRLRNTYDLQEDSKLAGYGAIQFRTQFADGYNYDAKVAGGDSLISGFLARLTLPKVQVWNIMRIRIYS